MELVMKKFLITLITSILLIYSISFAGDVNCYNIFTNQSVTAGSYIESTNILLSDRDYNYSGDYIKVPTDGLFSIQPYITEGTFDITVYFSNFRDASVWDSGTLIASGLTSSDVDRIAIDPNGVALWMKFKVTETSGTGNPSISISLCADQ